MSDSLTKGLTCAALKHESGCPVYVEVKAYFLFKRSAMHLRVNSLEIDVFPLMVI